MARAWSRRGGDGRPVAILGAGAVAAAFARRLAKEGVPLLIWARSRARGRALQRKLGFGSKQDQVAVARDLSDLAPAGHFVIAVTDSAIQSVATDLAQALGAQKSVVCLHTSGFFGEELLDPLAQLGWSTGTLHPLVALSQRGPSGDLLTGAWFATSGDDAARRGSKLLARALGGRVLELSEGGDKRVYHAAAALLAGGLVALFDAAEETLRDTISSKEAGREAFCDLARTVLENIQQQGPMMALTGPAMRGDTEVVEGHIEVIDAVDDHHDDRARVAALYRALSLRMLDLAETRGALTGDQRQGIEDRLAR